MLTPIGMDETSLKRGHNYVTLFVDLTLNKTLFVTQGKGSKTVCDFVDDLREHQGNAEHIRQVSCDMSPAFIRGVTTQLPNAQITFDRFHIQKIINKAVDQVRREEAKNNPLLKGTRYLFLKNYTNLSPKQQAKIEQLRLSKINQKTFRALSMREAHQQLYALTTLEQFKHGLTKWYYWATHLRLQPMIDAAKTIKKHWQGVINWMQSKINNGILEGLNSIIQATKRKARGYKLKHLTTIIYLLTADLDFSKVNANLPTRI